MEFVRAGILGIAAILALMSVAPAANAQSVAPKFGALAVDRTNGFSYGFAFDSKTREAAETRALEEVQKKGRSGAVVLVWSGSGCGVYRTERSNAGNAHGWGLAPTKEEADAIATAEASKRSGGRPTPHRVWTCNSKEGGPLKELYNPSSEVGK